jgi:predicted PurR-regulated permease PerM
MRQSRPVPWRTIWAAIASVVLAYVALMLFSELRRILVWVAVAAFFAVIFNPPVDFLVHRLHLRRGLAASLVYLFGLVVIVGVIVAMAKPLYDQGQEFADDVPQLVEQARHGEGPVGSLVTRFDLERRVAEQQEQLRSSVNQVGAQTMRVLSAVGTAVAATVTVLVLSFLMLLEAPRLLEGARSVLPEEHRERVSRVAADCSKAVTGYMAGNLLISVLAGVSTYLFLWALDVPFRGVLALWVAVADLIPLVGATLGAAVVIFVAFLHSPVAGFAALAFFIVYQQIENHAVQPVVQSRTVKLSPLAVLVSVLAGVELAGMLGALLAIPVAGMIQVIVRDLWDHRRGAPKAEPTVGVEELPATGAGAEPGSDGDGKVGHEPDADREPDTGPEPDTDDERAEPATVRAGAEDTPGA